MSCTLDTYALLTLEQAKDHLGITADDLIEDAFSIYHDKTQSATACTVAVDGNILTLLVTSGGNAGTYTYDLTAAANDTIGELITAILADTAGGEMIVRQHARSDAASTDIIETVATDCYGEGAVQTILFVDNCELIELINIVSDVIEFAADRHFAQRTWTETEHSDEDGWVQLRNFPINWIDRISVGKTDVLTVRCTASDAVSATVSINRNPIQSSTQESHTDRLELIISGGADNGTNTVTLASGTDLSSVASTIKALSGWTASVLTPSGGMNNVGNMPSDWLLEQGGVSALDSDARLQAHSEPISWFDPEFKYGRFKIGHKRAKIWAKYTAGFATIPDDIVWLAVQVLGDMVGEQERGLDSGSLKSERIGDYSYTRGDAGGGKSAAESALQARMAIIEPYRNVMY